MSSTEADLSTRARIRNAALVEFAQTGLAKTTIRAIAARAEVSPALVIHHFGSKQGLRAACDEHTLSWLRVEKTAAFSGMQLPTRAAYLEAHPEFAVLYAYLRRAAFEEGDVGDEFFDHFVADVAEYLAVGEEAGTVRPYADPHARAVISAAIGLGLMAFDPQIARHLGGSSVLDPVVLERYTAYTLDLYTYGMLTAPVGFAPDGADQEEES